MRNIFKQFVFLIGMLVLMMNNIYAQITPAQVEIGLDFSDNTSATFNNLVAFGLDPTATDGYDGLPFENALPPFSPALEVRFIIESFESYTDIRNAPAFPYSGVKTHTLYWNLSAGANALNVQYDFPAGVSVVFSNLVNPPSGPLTGAGTYTFANAQIVRQGTMEVTYSNFGATTFQLSVNVSKRLEYGINTRLASNRSECKYVVGIQRSRCKRIQICWWISVSNNCNTRNRILDETFRSKNI